MSHEKAKRKAILYVLCHDRALRGDCLSKQVVSQAIVISVDCRVIGLSHDGVCVISVYILRSLLLAPYLRNIGLRLRSGDGNHTTLCLNDL